MTEHGMNGLDRLCLILCLSMIPFAAFPAELNIHDAERFAALLRDTGERPSEREINQKYLQPGTKALSAFARDRFAGAPALSRALEDFRGEYRHAVAVCLPALRGLADVVAPLQQHVTRLLGQSASPDVYAVFGAGTSGGTALDEGVVVALEVLCRYAGDEREARRVLEEFIVHETAHWYQVRHRQPGLRDSLLRQSLIEGFADWVTSQVLGRVALSESARHEFGLQHERALWGSFRLDMDGEELRHWMYGPGRPGEPADLGYWLGKRILQAYYDSAPRKDLAIEVMLQLASPGSLLEESGYAPLSAD